MISAVTPALDHAAQCVACSLCHLLSLRVFLCVWCVFTPCLCVRIGVSARVCIFVRLDALQTYS